MRDNANQARLSFALLTLLYFASGAVGLVDEVILSKYFGSQQHTSRDAIVSTDDDRRLEYATPRNNVPGMPTIAETAAEIRKWRRAEVAEKMEAP